MVVVLWWIGGGVVMVDWWCARVDWLVQGSVLYQCAAHSYISTPVKLHCKGFCP